MMRKDSDAVKQWSLQLIENCASLQREILTNAESVVKPGGFLIYSTCTFNRTENEENVDFAVKELGLEPVELDFPEQWGIPRGISTPIHAGDSCLTRLRERDCFLLSCASPENGSPLA